MIKAWLRQKVISMAISTLLLIACLLPAASTPSPASVTSIATPVPIINDVFPTPVPVPDEWEPQLSTEDTRRVPFSNSDSIVALANGDLWITTSLAPELRYTSDIGNWLIRYKPEAKAVITYTITIEGGWGVPVVLLEARDDTVWGAGLVVTGPPSFRSHFYNTFPRPSNWMLSRYDATTEQFAQIQDADGLLRGKYAREIVEDKRGILWLIIDNMLVSFDPVSQKATRPDLVKPLADMSLETVEHLAVAPDGAIWLTAWGDKSVGWKVLRYVPDTGELQDYGFPSDILYDDASRLYFDRTGRLWLTSIAWVDAPQSLDSFWHPAIQPEAFVTQRLRGMGNFDWADPFGIYESSNGKFWFSSLAGLVKYDPLTDEWHLVHNLVTAIAEDNDHDLWVAADSQIYKYRLEP
ncbi:MAG: hypothetical protein AAB217_24545 [Chloroflexota bacterium]